MSPISEEFCVFLIVTASPLDQVCNEFHVILQLRFTVFNIGNRIDKTFRLCKRASRREACRCLVCVHMV